MDIVNKLMGSIREKRSADSDWTNGITTKVSISLIRHVYTQTNVAMMASLFCAAILFVGLYLPHTIDKYLYIWAGCFIAITFTRVLLVRTFLRQTAPETRLRMWGMLYTLGSFFSGIVWGSTALWMPYIGTSQQMLLILMLSGITAGAVPMSAGIRSAAILFLMASLIPLGITLLTPQDTSLILFDIALFVYLIYLIILVLRIHNLIKNSIILKFNNDILLHNLEIYNKKLEHAATHDPLTQIANRRLFQTTLEEAVVTAKQNNQKIALLYIDLDHFKSANDKFGHEAGDRILLTVIERMKCFFGTDKNIARLGGDELAVILQNVENIKTVKDTARELCHLIALPIKFSNNINLKVSASIGIGIYPDDGNDAESLLRKSDTLMYYVKEHGGDNYYLGNEVTN